MVAVNDSFRQHYPFSSHYLDLGDGQRLHYLDEGPRNAPVLVLLHGNPTWSFYFRQLITALRDRFRVIVPDHLGCGLSTKPRGDWRLTHHIAHLEELLLAHLGLQGHSLTLLMHDWGGAIAMGFARRHPDQVARLVILNTAAFYLPKLPWRIRICRWPVLGPLLVLGLNGFILGGFLFATAKPMAKPVRAGYLAPYRRWQDRRAILRFIRDIPLEPQHPSRQELALIEESLEQFRATPTLLLWGARDFCFTTAFYQQWRQRFPQAEAELYPEAGHWLLEDAPESITARIAGFLAATADAANAPAVATSS